MAIGAIIAFYEVNLFFYENKEIRALSLSNSLSIFILFALCVLSRTSLQFYNLNPILRHLKDFILEGPNILKAFRLNRHNQM